MGKGKIIGRIREFIKAELNELSREAILLRSGIVLAVSVLVAVAFVLYSLSNPKLEMPKTAVLRAENSRWKTRMEMLGYKLDQCEEMLQAVEDRNNWVYREMFGLGAVNDPVPVTEIKYIARYGENLDPDLLEALVRIDNLSARVVNQSKALDQSALFARRVDALATSIPSIPPVLPRKGSYHISSFFGSREDPVYGGRSFHRGIDISAKSGTPVYATGEGTVTIAERQRSGYGNMVMIDHGYGYKTRYAHLKEITVERGQHVRRGDLVGRVGRTGKATGPHLHYEVSQKGRQVNPMNFMDFSMSIEDYREILSAHRTEK